jgi:conjugal transfer mating pair stabilization protein TraG
MYEIYAYGDNDSLYGIFNAIAAIAQSDSYLGAVAIVVVCGFVTAAIAYALAPERLVGWKWLGSVLLVYSILLVPKVTVGIVDKLGTQPVQVVGNVPFGAAIFGHLTSVVGNTLTDLFETAFQVLPGPGELSADLSYQKHGLLFGNSLIRRSREATFPDPNFRTDLVNFIANCTMYDLADGTLDPAMFARSTNLWGDMANPNPARFSPISNANGPSQIAPCPAVYVSLDARRGATETQLYNTLASQLNPNLPAAQAQADTANEIIAAYQLTLLANASASAADIIRQNAMINAVTDASEIIGQKANDPASLLLAFGRAQATAQTNAAWMNFGKMAEDALPLIRNAIEAIAYALFPILLLLLLLTHGMGTLRVLQGYLFTLVWIQLWPVVYAILHYMATLASAKHIAAAADLGAGAKGLALLTASQVYSTVISDQAVVGYLVLSVPAIAWAAVKGMEAIGQAALTGVSSLQSMTGSATSTAAAGNLSAGNVSFEQQQLAPLRSAAAMRKFASLQGTETSDRLTGESRYEYLLGSNPLGMQDSQQIAQDASQASTKLEATARASLRSAETSLSAAVNEAQGVVRSSGHSQAYGTLMSLGNSGSDGTSVQDRRAAAESLARDLGIKDVSVADSALTARLGGRLPQGWSPIIGAIESAGSQKNANEIQAAVSNAERSLREKSLSHQAQVMTSFMNSDDFRSLRQSNQEAAHRIESAYQDYKATRHSYSDEQREADQYQEVARRAEVFSRTYTWNNVARFNEFLKGRGHLGSIDRDTITADFKDFLMSGGIASDGRGKEFWVPYDGTGPTPTNLRSDTNKNVVSNDPTFAATTSGNSFSEASVRDAAATNDRRVQTARSQSGLSPDRAVGSGDLAQKIDAERTAVTDKTSGGAVDVEMGRRQNVQQFKDAKENVPWWHKLGVQPDGRSAKQQLDKSKEPQSGGGTGDW